MARKKVREYPTVDMVRQQVDQYFRTHKHEVIGAMLDKTGFNSLEELRRYEFSHCGMDGDCGFAWVLTHNEAQAREWRLDGHCCDAYACGFNYPYNTQSTMLQSVMLHKALQEMSKEGMNWYYIITRLD